MKVLTGPHAPLQPAAELPGHRQKMALIGGAFGLFSLGALATALVLEGPVPATTAVCAECGTVEAVAPNAGIYQLKIRMGDGSARSVGHPQPLAVGRPVRLDGRQVIPLSADTPPAQPMT